MGGSNSTTKTVTLENDPNSGVVKVTEAAAKRVLGQGDQDQHEANERLEASRNMVNKEELERLEEHYRDRIRGLELKNAEMYQTTAEQFSQAVEEVEKKFLKTTAAPICHKLQDEVLKCYQENEKETLRCSNVVRAFKECVQSEREKVLQQRG